MHSKRRTKNRQRIRQRKKCRTLSTREIMKLNKNYYNFFFLRSIRFVFVWRKCVCECACAWAVHRKSNYKISDSMFMFVRSIFGLFTYECTHKMVRGTMEKVRRLNFLDIHFTLVFIFAHSASLLQKNPRRPRDLFACMSNYRSII